MPGITAARQFRVVALPLTTRTRTREALTYYHFVTAPPKSDKPPTVLLRAQNKASEIWAGFGKAEGGWKLKVFQYGERLVDRVDFEELSLNSLDPTLGPKISKFGKPEVELEKEDKHPHEKHSTPIPLIHPVFHSAPGPVGQSPVGYLEKLLDHRKPRHKRGVWTWVLIAPLTAPFMIVPVIPNLPFFFCVWRAWSHWKALKASDYLSSLLQRGAIKSQAHADLDLIYKRHNPALERLSASKLPESIAENRTHSKSDLPPSNGTSSLEPPQRLLLTREAVPDVLAHFNLPKAAGRDIYRAIEQARQRIAGGRV